MSPREFESLYGRPVSVDVRIPVGSRLIIPADPDRYLIVFWSASNPVQLWPGERNDLSYVGRTFSSGVDPVVIDHAHHGALAGVAWTVVDTGFDTTLTYVVGRMAPITRRNKSGGLYRAPQHPPRSVRGR